MSERKLQILQAIILNYLETAEPVGSRTISRRFLMDLSSATIRNEMSDLEEMGLIEQPHTSAGRIPSSKGYRLYVDQLMKRDTVDDQQMNILMNLLKNKTVQLDSLLREIGDLLSTMTKYPTVVTMPQIKQSALKHLQLMPLDEHSAILVLVTDGNIVRNHVIPLQHEMKETDLYRISDVLNKELSGLSLSQMDLPLIQKIKRDCHVEPEIMESLLNAISDTLEHAKDGDVFTSGATNILSFPEFSDIARARSLMEFFNQKDQILHMVSTEERPVGTGLKIRIGTENTIEQLHDCSIVTANYRYKDRTIGTISVVGPIRMDYQKVVSALEGLMLDFPDLFGKPTGPDIGSLPDSKAN
ncbi:MAG: heat-inducible transcription repressor HrcA [Firmicutes bacterium]|nr:heat-inducible transcription repressor HrcA [Bacillota bacterium]